MINEVRLKVVTSMREMRLRIMTARAFSLSRIKNETELFKVDSTQRSLDAR